MGAYNWNDSVRCYKAPSSADFSAGSEIVEQDLRSYVITVNRQEYSRYGGTQGVADEEFVLRVRI